MIYYLGTHLEKKNMDSFYRKGMENGKWKMENGHDSFIRKYILATGSLNIPQECNNYRAISFYS